MALPLRVAVYVRVSRASQNPQLQEDETRGFAERRGWLVHELFVDHGVSGTRDRRPALDRLIEDARRRRFDAIVVWKADRLFRSLKHMVTTLDELAAYGVGFVSVTEPFDTTTPQGRLLLHLVSAFGEFERQLLVERTCAGLDAARRRGARLGRPRASLDIERLLTMKAEGASLRAIAKALGCGLGTVQRALVAAQTQLVGHECTRSG